MESINVKEQLTPFEEKCLFCAMYITALGQALWQALQESLWATNSPSPWMDALEKHTVLLIALITLVMAVATMLFLYFAVSFGCLTGRGWGSNCTWASDWLARKFFG